MEEYMSTATWTIGREAAELIACDNDPKHWNLDRAWISNWALASANQYDWAALDDDESPSEIICWRCAVKEVLDGERKTAQLFTYEEGDEALCDHCNTIWLGGFGVNCTCCERWVWSVPNIHPETHLWGQHTPYTESGGAALLNEDGTENHDDRVPDNETGIWVCDACLGEHYGYDYHTMRYTKLNQPEVTL